MSLVIMGLPLCLLGICRLEAGIARIRAVMDAEGRQRTNIEN